MGSVWLDADPVSAGVARKFVAELLSAYMGPGGVEVVVLLTSEVVANAVVHAGTSVELVVRSMHGDVQIDVSDGATQMPEVLDPALGSVSGRGLQLVMALAQAWGVIPTPGGKTVWFRCRANRLEA